jgi:polyhydroxybutyrate depolymerase
VKAPGRYAESVTVGGMKRAYILRVPKAYDATKPLPLVVLLHGWTSNATTMEQVTKFAAKSEGEGFILATPEGLGERQGWNVGWIDLSFKGQDDVAFLTSLLDNVEKEVGVDPQRIYVAGHSNGAFLANLVGARLSKRIAAFASVAGTIGMPAAKGQAQKLIPTPASPLSVLLIHGKKDAMVAYATSAQALLVGFGAQDSAKWWARNIGASGEPTLNGDGDVVTETYKNGRDNTEVELVSIANGSHNWPSIATDLIWDFFKAHPKKS